MTIGQNRWLPHLVLILGVVVFVFPIYLPSSARPTTRPRSRAARCR
jgi:protein-S-isoprenylcysteine O-methyltransferase Ste14